MLPRHMIAKIYACLAAARAFNIHADGAKVICYGLFFVVPAPEQAQHPSVKPLNDGPS